MTALSLSLSLSLSPSCSWRGQGEWPRHVHGGAMQPTGTIVPSSLWIFGRDIPNQTYPKNIPKDYRQSRRNSDMVNITCTVPQSFLFPSLEASRQGFTTSKGREEALVDRRRNRGKSLTSDSPSSSDLPRPSEESEPDTHQGSSSHAKPSCLFCSILRRCSTNCQNPPPRRRHLDCRHAQLVATTPIQDIFFRIKKKIEKKTFDAQVKKKAFVWFQGRMSKGWRDPRRWRWTTVGKFLHGLVPSAPP